MMKLSTMHTVVATVDKQWESPLADKIRQSWKHDEGERAKYWRSSANFIFFFRSAGQSCVLRFNHANERHKENIQAEMAFVNELLAKGVPVAKPIRSLSGGYVETIQTDQGIFHAVAFEALPGEQYELENLSSEQVTLWGTTLGHLHNAAAQIAVKGRPSWQEQLAHAADILPTAEEAAHQSVKKLHHQLNQLTVNAHNFGLIHYDFELDNLIWNGEQVSIIDFDDSASNWFVADIAFALRDLFDDRADKVDLQNHTLQDFLNGYRTIRTISDDELQHIPLFLRFHNLIAFAKLHRALTPVHPAGEPTWMTELREKLARKMQTYREGFSSWV